MTERTWDIEKEAYLLNGAERARLVIKDDHEKVYKNNNGFLTIAEKQALLRMPDHRVKEEYEALWEIYEKMPRIMSAVAEAYLSFKYLYETLKKAHLLVNLSPAVAHLSQLVEKDIANEDVKKDALRILNVIQVLEIDSLGKPAFKETLSFIKWIVSKASEHARHFVLMKKTVDSINETMGFNIFMHEHYAESCQIFAEEISLCIEDHNRIMIRAGEGISDLSNYLIPELDYNANIQDSQEQAETPGR